MAGSLDNSYDIYAVGFSKDLIRNPDSAFDVASSDPGQSSGMSSLSGISSFTASADQFNGGLYDPVQGTTPPEAIRSGELPAIIGHGKSSFTDTTAGFRMGVDTDKTYKWIIGDGTSSADWSVTTASTLTIKGTITATAGRIGSWYINSSTLASASTAATSGILLDAGNQQIRVGVSSGNYILLDGPNQTIKSSNYSTGLDGFSISPTLIEAQNIQARGIMQGTTFQYDVVSCVGGQLMVANADVLDSDLAANATTLTTKDTTTFVNNDLLLIRALASTGVEEEWFRVIDASSAPTYRVTRDYAVNFAAAKTNLKGFWRFDENTGSSARDSTVNANHGTIVNASYVDGRYGKALSFNGSSAYVSVADNAAFKPTTAITIAFWIYWTGSTYSQIIHRQDFFAFKGYDISVDATNQLQFGLGDGTANTYTFCGVNSVPLNTWTHFVCTWSNGGALTVYKNGSLLAVSSTFAGPISYAAGDLYFGRNSLAAGGYFTGYLDEIRIYNTGITSGQALTMYNGETPLFYKGCTIAKQGKSNSIATYSGGWLRLIGEGTNSPYYSVFTRTGVAYNSYSEVIRVGNLNGTAAFVSDTYGIFIGNYSTGKYLTYDDTSGNLVVNGYIQSTTGTFGGDGSDGALSSSSGTTTIDLGSAAIFVKLYSSISITGTAKIAFSNPHASGTIVIFKCSGDATITSSTVPCIEISSLGGAGGAGASAGTSPGTQGTSGAGNIFTAGSGGGGVQSPDNAGGSGGTAIGSYSTRFFKIVNLVVGGGGGGGATGAGTAGAGGRGGGAFYMEVKGALNFTGTINANGANGTNGTGGAAGGGGGGAGSVIILYNTLTANSGTINTTGGTGGTTSTSNSGGAGGGGGSATAGTTPTDNDASTNSGGTGGNGYSIVAQNNSFA